MFEPDIYKNRRHLLKQRLGSGVILFPGHDESPINFTDNSYPFRQDSSFLYFFGHNRPGLTGVVDIDGDMDYLFGSDTSMDDMVWTGYQPPVRELGHMVGISRTGTLKELDTVVERFFSAGNTIHFLPPYRAETKLKLLRWCGSSEIAPSTELIKAVIAQREIKSSEEILHIEESVNISVDMHIFAIRIAEVGITEQQVVASIYGKTDDLGVSMAFTPIATIRGETLHNHFYGNRLKDGDLFLLDAGVENAMHYASDLSSTFPVDGKFTAMQKEIYTITLDAHEAAVAALKPQIPFKDVHLKACKKITAGLKNLGLMKGDVDEAVGAGAHALFFPCGTGHMMGLDVHDMEDLGELYVGYDGEAKSSQFGLKSLRLAKPLKPGFVLTIEPGIYFIPALIDKWRSEKRFVDFINYKAREP